MRNLLLTLAYDGRAYHGFQIQNNADTVQARLQEALALTLPSLPDIKGCSRTDTGVHARMFCVSLRTESTIGCDRLPAALNSRLPQDIAVLSCREVPDDFHARYSVVSKRYRYEILNRPIRDPFLSGRAALWQYPIDEELLHREAQVLVGRHDFSAFCSAGGSVEDKVRTVSELSVSRCGDMVYIDIEADGFLYNMVRIIVGTLLDINRGRIAPGELARVLESCDRSCAGFTAPPDGLYLEIVRY